MYCASSVGSPVQSFDQRTGTHPGPSPRRGAEAPGAHAADEVPRRGFVNPVAVSRGHGGAFPAGNRISARLFRRWMRWKIPQRVCRELARIVQEGLVNVRKHSAARQVLVRLTSANGHWQLAIEDNGQGFRFQDDSPRRNSTKWGKAPWSSGSASV